MLAFIFKPLSWLPLPLLHVIGATIGRVMYYTMQKSRGRARANIKQSQLATDHLTRAVKQNFINLGQAVLETPYIWHRKAFQIDKLMQEVVGWEHVLKARQSNSGIIFLTPHMGCFEVTSLYYALHYPVTVLYRAPKKKWLIPFMQQGREKNNITLAEANASGVRVLVKALKRGEAIGILPDQLPGAGEGEWANFFGKPAYTMTLASKLAAKTGATVIMAFGERLNHGKGYRLHLTPVSSIDTTQALNHAIEKQIQQCPSQYYWHYNRYKVSKKGQAQLKENQDSKP